MGVPSCFEVSWGPTVCKYLCEEKKVLVRFALANVPSSSDEPPPQLLEAAELTHFWGTEFGPLVHALSSGFRILSNHRRVVAVCLSSLCRI